MRNLRIQLFSKRPNIPQPLGPFIAVSPVCALVVTVTAGALPVGHVEYRRGGQGRVTLAEHPHLLAGDEHLHVPLALTQHFIPEETGQERILWGLLQGCSQCWVCDGSAQ